MRAFLALLIVAVAVAIFWWPAKPDYEPLAVGAVWTMNVAAVGAKGTLNTTAVRTIEGKVTRNGKTYFSAETRVEGRPGSHELIRKDENGVYEIEDTKDPNAKEHLSIMLPFKEGLSWDGFSHGEPIKTTVVGLETVTINGKNYDNCYHVQTKWVKNSNTQDHWDAPNIGTVKVEMNYAKGASVTISLVDYKPGNK